MITGTYKHYCPPLPFGEQLESTFKISSKTLKNWE